MKFKKYIKPVAIVAVAFAVGRFSAPKSVEIKEVEKVVYRENQNTRRDQNYVEVVREIRAPDGTVTKETRKEKETSTQTQREVNSETERLSEKKIENRPSFRVGVGYEPAIPGFQYVTYTVTLEKRIFGEFYIGVSGSSRQTVGVTISLGF